MRSLSCPLSAVQDRLDPWGVEQVLENARAIRHPETHLTLADACLARRLIYSL